LQSKSSQQTLLLSYFGYVGYKKKNGNFNQNKIQKQDFL